jgi:hypothetical protein
MPENGDSSGSRNDGPQELQPLGAELGLEEGDSRDVLAGSGEARYVAGSYRICMGDGDDRDRRSRCFQRPGEERTSRYDQVQPELNQVSRELRESSGVALDPPVFDPEIHALVPAAFPENLPEGLPLASFLWISGLLPQDTDAECLPRLLRLAGERCSEKTAGYARDERSSVHHSTT